MLALAILAASCWADDAISVEDGAAAEDDEEDDDDDDDAGVDVVVAVVVEESASAGGRLSVEGSAFKKWEGEPQRIMVFLRLVSLARMLRG